MKGNHSADPTKANAARVAFRQEAVRKAGAWLDELVPDSDIITRRLVLVVTGSIQKFSNEYAALVGIHPRTARAYLQEALEVKP